MSALLAGTPPWVIMVVTAVSLICAAVVGALRVVFPRTSSDRLTWWTDGRARRARAADARRLDRRRRRQDRRAYRLQRLALRDDHRRFELRERAEPPDDR